MKDFLFLVLGLILIFGSFILFFNKLTTTKDPARIIRINDVTIQVDIADTQETRVQGLSGRDSLAEGTGMLFVFDKPAQYGFWMKDMKFSVDIIWIDDKFRIIGVEKDISPETFPQIFSPDKDVKYVLEFSTGSSDRYNIKIGDVIQYE